MARGDAATSLAPGFRFHPTDEELVRYYLKRKVTNKPFRFDPISVVDVYKSEPWDLPGKSKLKSRDLEWYFFSMLDKKYNNGSKTNRATEKGYWKTTGKDRAILWGTRIVGMKKTLVYHRGRAPRGERTNWVMHEYRLADEELEKAGFAQDAYVLCRIFQKSGPGPKNGERYGAPLIEEEWDNDEEVAVLPGQELLVADEVIVPFDEYVETNDLDQNFDIGTTFENAVLPINFDYGGASNYVEHSGNFVDADLKPIVGGDISQYGFDLPDEQNLLALPGQEEMDSKSVNDAFVAQPSSNMGIADVNYTINPYFAATDDSHVGEAIFVPNNDILNPVVPGSMVESSDFDMVEDYLIFFDAEDENLTFDPSELMGSDNATNEEPLPKKDVNGESEEVSIMVPKPSEMQDNHDASCSKKKPMPIEFEPDTKPSYFKQATHLLGGVPASPAFASEFPVKGAALQLHPGQSSSSIRVTAGMVRIESTTTGGNLLDWSFGKSRDVNVVFSFGLSQANSTDASLVPMGNLFLPGKAESLASLSWLFLMLFWVLIFSLSYKVGVYVCTK